MLNNELGDRKIRIEGIKDVKGKKGTRAAKNDFIMSRKQKKQNKEDSEKMKYYSKIITDPKFYNDIKG